MADFNFSLKNKFKSFIDFLKCYKKTIVLVTIVATISVAGTLLISMLYAPSTVDYYLPSQGNIYTLGVEAYSDSTCESRIEQISWDVLEPGETVNKTVFIKSVSNSPVTLNVNLTDWEPVELSNYISISWNYDSHKLAPSDVISVTLMLSASSSDDFVYFLVENEIQSFAVNLHFFGAI